MKIVVRSAVSQPDLWMILAISCRTITISLSKLHCSIIHCSQSSSNGFVLCRVLETSGEQKYTGHQSIFFGLKKIYHLRLFKREVLVFIQNTKVIVSKKNFAGSITIPDFKAYYKAIIIKTSWYWHKSCYVEQWNRSEKPEINPHTNSQLQLIFDKSIQTIQWNRIISSTNGAGKTRCIYVEE